VTRSVEWGSLHNVWDLGALPTASGFTLLGRVFRSANPDGVDEASWTGLAEAVCTIVDLRNDYEVTASVPRPPGVSVVRRPVEDQADDSFMADWGDRLGSPAYYPEVLARWPTLVAEAFTAIADAPDGGVLLHCMAGRDRTGMIVAMLLLLAGVRRGAILDDWEAAARAINEWWGIHGGPKGHFFEGDVLEEYAARGRGELDEFLDGFSVEPYLIGAGVTAGQVSRLKSRLLDE
jgi:protein-tyrosine phosphatase